MSKGNATRKVSIEYDVDDIAKALMGTMSNFHNKERLSRFIANSMMDSGTATCSELIRRINGSQPEIGFPINMILYANDYGVGTWRMNKDLTVTQGYGKYQVDSVDRIWVKAKIIEIDPDSVKPYLVEYTCVSDNGEAYVNEAWVEERMLIPLIEL